MNRPSYGYSAGGPSDPSDPSNPSAPQAQPVCPRHPDRVSYVRCKRCNRPACPDCQRPAAVGMLCVECENELSRQQASARPRNAMGGTMGRSRPVVTYTVMALSILAHIGQLVAPDIVFQLGAFAPFRALAMPWTFLTGGFLHGGLLHLALNMYLLWIMGQSLERALGHVRFTGLYLASILGGHTAIYLIADPLGQSWFIPTVGASGGVFGLFAATFIVNRRMGASTAQIAVLIGANMVLSFFIPNISWQGHLGGLLMGALLTAGMFALRPKASPGADRQALARRSAAAHGAVIIGGIVLCLVLVLLKVLTLTML